MPLAARGVEALKYPLVSAFALGAGVAASLRAAVSSSLEKEPTPEMARGRAVLVLWTAAKMALSHDDAVPAPHYWSLVSSIVRCWTNLVNEGRANA